MSRVNVDKNIIKCENLNAFLLFFIRGNLAMDRIIIKFPAGKRDEAQRLCCDMFHDHLFLAYEKDSKKGVLAYAQIDQEKPLEDVFTEDRIASLRAIGYTVIIS